MLSRLDRPQSTPPSRREAHELGERIGDALHALSREPDGAMGELMASEAVIIAVLGRLGLALPARGCSLT
jgi:hypothetical protein